MNPRRPVARTRVKTRAKVETADPEAPPQELRFDFTPAPVETTTRAPATSGGSIKQAIIRWLNEQL